MLHYYSLSGGVLLYTQFLLYSVIHVRSIIILVSIHNTKICLFYWMLWHSTLILYMYNLYVSMLTRLSTRRCQSGCYMVVKVT